MDSQSEQKKNKDYGLNLLKSLFEIKRPVKSAQSATLPRTKTKSGDDFSVSKDKVFERHHSHRRSSRRNKYKKENSQKYPDEKFALESDSQVKKICQQFELAQINEQPNNTQQNKLVKNVSSTIENSKHNQEIENNEESDKDKLENKNSINETNRKERENKSRMEESNKNEPEIENSTEDMSNHEKQGNVIEKVLANRETQLNLLRELYENAKIKKRIYEKNSKKTREKKIQSFVDAENDEETEEYRKSLVSEMDMELAQMKEDGFLDDEENILTNNSSSVDEDDVFDDGESSFLQQMRRNRVSNDSDTYTVVGEDTLEITVYNNNEERRQKQQKQNAKEIEADTGNEEEQEEEEEETEGKSVAETILIARFDDEFSDSLADELENGLHIVEAYNDEGRELIEIQVVIDRRTINFHTNQSIDEAIQQSDMIFYQNEDKSYDLIRNANEEYERDKSSTIETSENEQNGEVVGSKKSDIENMCDLMKEELATSRNQEALYEYIEIPNEDNPQQPFYVFAPLSNRSTVYSTTSQESSNIDDDDEGIEVSRIKDQEQVYQNVRRETFCDDKGIVRIERVAFSENTPFTREDVSAPVSRSNSITPSKRLEYIMDEIKSTEKKYLGDLAKVLKVYKPYIENNTTPYLKNYQGYLFGNMEKIYRRQRKFQDSIEKCTDVDDIVQCFINNEILFELYPTYFRNKPKADSVIKDFSSIIKEMQEKFEERLDFSAYLLTPVQRLGKYILLLENIEKELEKMGESLSKVQTALEIVKDEMSKGNDSVAIESIENSPISKMDYGSFKMREKFNILKPRKVEASMVFIFTNVVVFTTTDAKNLETFHFYDSIKMNDLRIATFDDFTIHLTDFTKSKKKQNSSRYTYILESKSEKVWKSWKEAIEKILWDQLVKAKENSLNMSVQNGRRLRANRGRIKSAGSSVFYCE